MFEIFYKLKEFWNEYNFEIVICLLLLFFLIIGIICSVLNIAGWDIQTSGGMIFLVGLFVWAASIPGFLTLVGATPFALTDQYFISNYYFVIILYMI